MDIQKLTKLMNLTLSDNDHEALSSMRMANRLVRDAGLMWNSMLKCPGEKFCTHAKPAPSPAAPKPQTPPRRDPDLPLDALEMIDELLNHEGLSPGTLRFIEGLDAFYAKNGRLSEKQYEVLFGIYERAQAGFGG